jgi:hypothetical protein
MKADKTVHEWTFKMKEAAFLFLRDQSLKIAESAEKEKFLFQIELLDPNGNTVIKNLADPKRFAPPPELGLRGDGKVLTTPPEGRQRCLECLLS